MKIQAFGLLALAASAAQAFVGPQSTTTSLETSLAGTTKQPPFIPMPQTVAYGEESRKYRRTVFTHEDWVKHRSPDRFVRQLAKFGQSGIYSNVFREVAITTAVAAGVVVYNTVCGGYDDLAGQHHEALVNSIIAHLQLPMNAFTLVSPSLGLLLVFRTNTSYQRWDEARKNWGMNINHTRDLVRLATAFYDDSGVAPEKRKKDLNQVALSTWAFVRAMKRHLSPEWDDEDQFREELHEKLPKEQAEAIIRAAHRPNRALFDLSLAVENLPMHFLRKNEIQRVITIFEDNLGSSERILSSPVPIFYSRHLARFLSVWLLLLPFALFPNFADTWNGIGLIPATFLVSTFLFGIEELSAQMEEPFTILPMQGFCDKIYNWCMEIVSWIPGDNGMPIVEASKEHQVVWDSKVVNGAPYRIPVSQDNEDAVAKGLAFWKK